MLIKEQIQSLQRGLTVDESFSSSRPLASLRHQVRPWPQRPVLTPQSVRMSQRLPEGRKRPRVAGQGDCYALRQICGEMGPSHPTAWPSPGRLPAFQCSKVGGSRFPGSTASPSPLPGARSLPRSPVKLPVRDQRVCEETTRQRRAVNGCPSSEVVAQGVSEHALLPANQRQGGTGGRL